MTGASYQSRRLAVGEIRVNAAYLYGAAIWIEH
jgi:hypothetical protein